MDPRQRMHLEGAYEALENGAFRENPLASAAF